MNKWFQLLTQLISPGAFKKFNMILFFVMLAVGILAFVDIFLIFSKFDVTQNLGRISQATELAKKIAVKEKPPLSYSSYASEIGDRNLFLSVSQSSGNAKISSSNAASAAVLKNISLVGVLSGDSPQAILEDIATHKTYTLGKGQNLNNVIVKDIGDNTVVLEYNGESQTLTL